MEALEQPDNVLNINKPLEWTSFDVVNRLKFHIKRNYPKYKNIKIGHAGTLDPLATGVLLVCLGKATKRITVLQDTTKEYTGTIFLGATTPSFDLETEIDQRFDISAITTEQIHATAQSFIGKSEQIPPLYSAKKVNGVRAYEMARAGSDHILKSNPIEIFCFAIEAIELPEIKFRLRCTKGTYIRSIASDFGKKLGNGAHLSSLCRSASGDFTLENSLEMADAILQADDIMRNLLRN